jgi:hypothetical protein
VTRTTRCISAAVAVLAAATVFEGSILLAQETVSCAEIPTAAERLACYDRVSPPKEVAPTAPATGTAPPGTAGGHAHSAAVAAPADAPSSEDEESAVPVVVIGMRKYPGRSATFTTDNGDVWVQIGAEGVYLPKVPFKAELRPASMGTFFLRPADYGWRVHVRRND